MATIGQLVRAIANVSGLEESAVKLIARYARESGFIGQQSTGAGAAKMTSSDAANLLIALNASDLAKDVEQSTRLYSSLISSGSDDIFLSDAEEAAFKGKSIYKACSPGLSFSEALSKLIDYAKIEDNGVSHLSRYLDEYKSSDKDYVWLRVIIVRPNPIARIEVMRFTGNSFEDPPRLETDLSIAFELETKEKKPIGDRTAEYKCTNKTLQALANCIFS